MKQINVGDTVYFETLDDEIDSMVVAKINGDILYDNNGSFLMKDEIINEDNPRVVKYIKRHPVQEKELPTTNPQMEFMSEATSWLNKQAGRVITKKLVSEFSDYMSLKKKD